MNDKAIKSTPESLKSQNGGGIAERNIGIDALRLLSMFYVVILHILAKAGILYSTVGIKNGVVWLLEAIACCAVDIYAILSGYVGFTEEQRPFKSSKYIAMWLQVFCYSFGITLITFLIKPQSIGWKTLVKSLLPVTMIQYWYFTAFTVVFLLKPWINRFIRKLSKKDLTTFSLLVFGLFSCYSVFASRLSCDPFKLSDGFCALWLLILYIVGAWLKKCDIVNVIGNRQTVIVIVGCTLIMWIGRQFLPSVFGAGILFSYLSPTVLLSAIGYVVLFSKVKPAKVVSKLITFLAPAAFGVYLVHAQPIVWDYLMQNLFVWMCDYSAWIILFLVLILALTVFLSCILIEKIRILFFRLLRIGALVNYIGGIVDSLLRSIENKFDFLIKIDE